MKLFNIDLEEYLIALALLFVIPMTVHFGTNIIAPRVDTQPYLQAEKEFFKGTDPDDREHVYNEWKKTQSYQEYQQKYCHRSFIHLLIKGPVACVIFYGAGLVLMPIISTGLVGVGIILSLMSSVSDYCSTYAGVQIVWIELLFAIVSLVLVVKYLLKE